MKRSSARLIAKQSPHHTSVILSQSEDLKANTSESPRRSTKRIKIEHELDESLTSIVDHSTGSKDIKVPPEGSNPESGEEAVKRSIKGKRRAVASSSPKKIKQIPQALAKPHPAPLRWKEQYDTIQRMRSRIVAPVDTMGCDQAQWKEVDPKVGI
jgi:endonuclease III